MNTSIQQLWLLDVGDCGVWGMDVGFDVGVNGVWGMDV
jgi:hypothetical protein